MNGPFREKDQPFCHLVCVYFDQALTVDNPQGIHLFTDGLQQRVADIIWRIKSRRPDECGSTVLKQEHGCGTEHPIFVGHSETREIDVDVRRDFGGVPERERRLIALSGQQLESEPSLDWVS